MDVVDAKEETILVSGLFSCYFSVADAATEEVYLVMEDADVAEMTTPLSGLSFYWYAVVVVAAAAGGAASNEVNYFQRFFKVLFS